jgi:hypothetical protein
LTTPTVNIFSLNLNVSSKKNNFTSDINTVVKIRSRLCSTEVIVIQSVNEGNLTGFVVVGLDGYIVSCMIVIRSSVNAKLVSWIPIKTGLNENGRISFQSFFSEASHLVQSWYSVSIELASDSNELVSSFNGIIIDNCLGSLLSIKSNGSIVDERIFWRADI